MTLANKLSNANIQWEIDSIEVSTPSERDPGQVNISRNIRVRLTDLNNQNTDRQTLDYVSKSDDEDLTIERLLALALRKNMSKHAVFLEWLETRGHEPVVVNIEELTDENIGSSIHTALRKVTDSQQSIIQWNAINHLLKDDWVQFLKFIREEIIREIELVNTGKSKYLSRYRIGMAIQRVFTERFEEVAYRIFPDSGKIVERTDLQKFALQSLSASCRLTDNQDFIWAWTAYICEDVENSKEIEKQ